MMVRARYSNRVRFETTDSNLSHDCLCGAELNREVLGQNLLTVPHKMDENIWRSRQQLEEILHLLEPAQLDDVEVRIYPDQRSYR